MHDLALHALLLWLNVALQVLEPKNVNKLR
ncbi:hypothetical protein Goshw_022722, partial [Gossypium schwendimanii]|nr:hypothetical protein [Gossypium schwendimanii]